MTTKRKVLMPRESGQIISQSATSVFIENEGILKLAKEIIENLKNGQLSIRNFSQHVYHPNPDDSKAVDWLFVIDTLNFCFWPNAKDPKWKVNGESGYFALCAAVKRALEFGIPLTDSHYLSKITLDDIKSILKGDEGSGEIPLIHERVKNLNEIGQVLIDKYNGTFLECLKACEHSAEKLLKLIVTDFPCFRDEAIYNNQHVSFYKRAQILVGDIWACFEGKSHGAFNDIDYITMFPDYRVPQVLIHFGAMRYSNSLTTLLKSNTNLEPGSIEEIEIRGCSIEAVERVVKEIKLLNNENPSLGIQNSDYNSILVDHFLWDYRRKHVAELDHIPYHKIRTIYY